MKKLLCFFAALGVMSTAAFAQNSSRFTTDTKPGSLGIHFNALDFVTPRTIKDKDLPTKWPKFRDMSYGFGISYWKGLHPNLDLSVRSNLLFHEYASDRGEATNKTELGAELEPTLNLRFLRDNHLFSPFLTAGIGAGYYTDEFAPYVPAGLGFQFNLNSLSYIILQANHRWSLAKDDLDNHMMYSIGFLQSIGKEKPLVVVPPVPVVTDRDGDGVPDSEDLCPDTAGTAALHGCPDRDGDGIADVNDKCPDQAGVAKYEGCPVPDSDGDGINDEVDKCPNQAGVERYQGCPIPDTDGDGVNDEEDKCKDRPGPASNQGCPEIAKEVIERVQFAAKNVYFATGSYKLLAKSNKSLNEVAKIMQDDSSLMLDIDGHTDSQGSDELNQTLSENRAKAVLDYLVKQGVDESRLKSTGFGESKPVADNNTAAGRAKNRRTEMTVRNF